MYFMVDDDDDDDDDDDEEFCLKGIEAAYVRTGVL
jgi:hypothetical protein